MKGKELIEQHKRDKALEQMAEIFIQANNESLIPIENKLNKIIYLLEKKR